MSGPTERLLACLPDARPAGDKWSARCPAHDDNHASLSIAEADDGRALVYCHAGCTPDAICRAVGLRLVDLMPTADRLPIPDRPRGNGKPTAPKPNGKPTGKRYATMAQAVEAAEALVKRSLTPGREIVGRIEYPYHDGTGQVVGAVVRCDLSGGGKDIRPVAMVDGQWSIGAMPTPRPLYGLPDVLSAPEGARIYVTEGEKAADAAGSIGLICTTSPGGCKAAQQADWSPLAGREVVILPDADKPGRKYAETVAGILARLSPPANVRIVDLPGLSADSGDDIHDWLENRDAIEPDDLRAEIEELADNTPTLSDTWPEIELIDEVNLPRFPTKALPPALRDWVEAESQATQTPADLAGLLALSVCAACLARRVTVEPRSGWREPTNLFTVTLLPPGNRKSAVFGDALAPLREFETELIEAAQPTVARELSERRQSEARLKKLERLAVDQGDDAARHDAGNLAAELEQQTVPVLPRLLVDDATTEKLGMLLADQQGRIASMSAEGGVFDLMAGMYSKNGAPSFDVYLKAHAGDDLVTDRVTRESIRVERPALTCAYAVQPTVIEGLAGNRAFRGRGLLARFLYAAPRSWVGQRAIAPPSVLDHVRQAYRETVRKLASIEGEFTLRLASEAEPHLHEWERETERMLDDGGEMESIRDWGAKLVGATLRLAGTLHCAEHGPEGSIDAQTLTAAIEIGRYLIPHADAVLSMMTATENATHESARYVLRWIERHDRREFSRRDAQQDGRRQFPKAEDIDPVLAELTRRGYIRSKPTGATGSGRPPSPTYEVNPAFFEINYAETCTHYSQNSGPSPENHNIENIENGFKHYENGNRMRGTI